MAYLVTIRNKDLEIKFNYRLMFKANKELGTSDENGNKNNNGASELFRRVLEKDDTAIFDIIKIAHTGKPLTDDELFEAVEKRFEGEEDEALAYDKLFDDMKEEMLESGFFTRKLEKQIETMEKGAKIMKKDPETRTQAEMLDEMLSKMKKEISSHNAQE